MKNQEKWWLAAQWRETLR